VVDSVTKINYVQVSVSIAPGGALRPQILRHHTPSPRVHSAPAHSIHDRPACHTSRRPRGAAPVIHCSPPGGRNTCESTNDCIARTSTPTICGGSCLSRPHACQESPLVRGQSRKAQRGEATALRDRSRVPRQAARDKGEPAGGEVAAEIRTVAEGLRSHVEAPARPVRHVLEEEAAALCRSLARTPHGARSPLQAVQHRVRTFLRESRVSAPRCRLRRILYRASPGTAARRPRGAARGGPAEGEAAEHRHVAVAAAEGQRSARRRRKRQATA
jgi:hypothetical protein